MTLTAEEHRALELVPFDGFETGAKEWAKVFIPYAGLGRPEVPGEIIDRMLHQGLVEAKKFEEQLSSDDPAVIVTTHEIRLTASGRAAYVRCSGSDWSEKERTRWTTSGGSNESGKPPEKD